MASYNKFNAFVADVSNAKHNLASDQLTIALTTVAPVATNAVLADLTQIVYTGYSSRSITTVSSTQTSGTYHIICNNVVLTATGSVAAFRYIVIYNSTASGGPLIAWYDYGSTLTLNSGDSFTVSFDNVNGVFTLV